MRKVEIVTKVRIVSIVTKVTMVCCAFSHYFDFPHHFDLSHYSDFLIILEKSQDSEKVLSLEKSPNSKKSERVSIVTKVTIVSCAFSHHFCISIDFHFSHHFEYCNYSISLTILISSLFDFSNVWYFSIFKPFSLVWLSHYCEFSQHSDFCQCLTFNHFDFSQHFDFLCLWHSSLFPTFGFLDFLLLFLDKVGSLALHPRVFCFHIHLAWCQRRRVVVIINFVMLIWSFQFGFCFGVLVLCFGAFRILCYFTWFTIGLQWF